MAGSASRDTSSPRVNEARQYLPLLALPVLGLLGWFGGQPLTITLIYGTTWAAYAVGYDMFSGFSGRVNLGYAMFPATAAYATAVLSARFNWPVALSLPAGIAAALLLAALVGALTLRIKGIYFALSTSIVPLALFQITHVFGKFFGGEEGIWGVPPVFSDPRYDLLVLLGLLGISVAFSLWYVRSKAGLVLRAIQGSDLTAQALGVDTFRFLFVSLLCSAAIGGAAGAYLTHFQMLVAPEILQIVTTLQIITFAQIGGPGTILGPAVGGLVLVFLNEQMRAWADLRLFAYFVVLVVLLRFSPEGLLAPAARGLARLLRGGRER
ncbi:MAG TPA: branched-chain amino acid ABC transporter permease [Candidatus Baltobacteraceae bacterium]|nr:branched-chain amino acid ABC transporter permease [Candidatus Baltobacteraceae bacterium]